MSSKSDDNKNVWYDSTIKFLIELRREKEKYFASNRNKNKLWEDISKEMTMKNCGFDANVCSNKWRLKNA